MRSLYQGGTRDDAIAAGALGRVERLVGRRDQAVDIRDPAIGNHRDTGADRDRDALAVVTDRKLLDGGPDPVREGLGVCEFGLAAQDRELLAAVPREHVLGA